MGVFTRLFSRESGAVTGRQEAQAGANANARAPTELTRHESEGSELARTSIIEVPASLIELTEDDSSDVAIADAPLADMGSSVRRKEPAAAAAAESEPPAVTRTVKKPPPKLPPLPIRKGTKSAPAPSTKEDDDAVELAIDALLEAQSDEDADTEPRAASDKAASDKAATETESDRRALLETFSGVAKLYVQPLRELMFQLSNGCTPRAWAEACRPLLSPLIHSAKQIGLKDLAQGLAVLDRALSSAAVESGALIGAASRVDIQEAYAKLGTELPEAFGAPRASDGRRTILLESLLLQVPGLHRRGIGKLYAAGLCSVAQLAQGSAEELSQATGIDHELALRVIEHVQKFELERHGLDATGLRQAVHAQLRGLLARLSQLQSEFERAEQAEDRVAKKAVRRAREIDVLKLQRLLAELGELELVEELKRCSVRAKLQRVESYLQRAEPA